MHYRDLREWLRGVDSFGELRIVEGADWNQEIGAIAEIAAQSNPPPAVLFDNIKDYPAGRRVLTGIHNPTLKRQCLTNHLPLDYSRDQFIDAWKQRLDNPKLIPPREVDSGPVMENVFEGKDIDLLSLPAPYWHEGDGGRYLGSLDITISRDLDEGWINLGCYRVMVHDRNTLVLYNILTKDNHFQWPSASARTRSCGSSARWKYRPDSRNTIMQAACAANHSKLLQARIRGCRFRLTPKSPLKAK